MNFRVYVVVQRHVCLFFFFEDFSPLHVETTMSYEAGGRMSFSWRT